MWCSSRSCSDVRPHLRKHSSPVLHVGLVAGKPLGNMIILVACFAGFGTAFWQKLAPDPFERVKLETGCRTHLKLAPVDQF
jgi:hypothetical protein